MPLEEAECGSTTSRNIPPGYNNNNNDDNDDEINKNTFSSMNISKKF